MTAPVTLYGMNSPNVRKVALLLEELALPYDLVHVAVFRGEQFTPDFLALNPLGKVPVLVDPALGRPLAESGAILFYLAEAHERFLPPAGADRHEVMQWVMVQMANIGPMLGQLNHFQMPGQRDSQPYALGRYTEIARRLYRLLDDRLSDREWIAGDAYSIADIATWPWATYLEQHGFDPAAHPALVRWRDALAARPAVQAMTARTQGAFTAPSTTARQGATAAELDRFFSRTSDMPAADYSAISR
ncbi:MAG: glutathione S-transferase family protein [Sphingobium sp.]